MLRPTQKLADYDDPLVLETAEHLIEGETTVQRKLASLFYYVRDQIKFRFPLEGDLVKASETIKSEGGQCNTKGTLFLALCKAAGIPARLHFSLIDKKIQKGFFAGPIYWLLPKNISHSWLEVLVDGKWRRIDSYINDQPLHEAAVRELKRRGWQIGFSVALGNGESSPEFNLDEEHFEQMGAVTDDHGVWDEPAEYYASEKYQNRPGPFRLFLYEHVVDGVNKKVATLRQEAR